MIIFDFNQVAISNLMEQIGSSKTAVEESLVRHMILNSLRTYVKKFRDSHGPEVIIACDNFVDLQSVRNIRTSKEPVTFQQG